MIDWLKARFPVPDEWLLPLGALVRLDADGAIDRTTILPVRPVGSHDATVSIRQVERGWVEFDGNPSKFLQGHNLVGSDDVCGLGAAAFAAAMSAAWPGLAPAIEAMRLTWERGGWTISRLDLTQSFELESREDVRAWLRAAGETAGMRYRGRASTVGTTLYFGKVANGKRASRWSLKAYCKADEIDAAGRSHRLPDGLAGRDVLTAWVQKVLRVEVLLRAAELQRIGDGEAVNAAWWSEERSMNVFEAYWSKVELPGQQVQGFDDDGLKPSVKAAYNLWLAGADCARVYPRATFYRLRRQVLDATEGQVDIRTLRGKGVVKLSRVLELRPAEVPPAVAATAWQRAA